MFHVDTLFPALRGRAVVACGWIAGGLVLAGPLHAQSFNNPADPADVGTPDRLIGEGFVFPEAPVDSIGGSITLSSDGRVAGRVRTSFLDFTTFEQVQTDRFYGGDPDSPGVLLSEGDTIASALGLARLNTSGALGYSAKVDTGAQFDPDGIFLDLNPSDPDELLLAQEGQAVPVSAGVGALTFDTGTTGLIFTSIANDGDVSYRGEYDTTQPGVVNAPGSTLDGRTGTLVGQALFQYDVATGTTSTLYQTGDVILDPNGASYVVGAAEIEAGSVSPDVERVGNAQVSDNGQNYAATFDVNPVSNVLNVDGNTYALAVNDTFVTFTDGTTIREDEIAPTSIGGNGTTTTIRSIGSFDINDDASFATALRLGTPGLNVGEDPETLSVLILDGESVFDSSANPTESIENVDLNNDGDVAFTFAEAIYLNGQAILEPGDALSDGSLLDITGGLALSDRDANDVVTLAFRGRTGVGQGETAFYTFDVQLPPLPIIPEPAAASLLAGLGLMLTGRRR